ncbi:MW1434 family type I TA system toxin [Xenorhabdus sp. TH1]|uniref:Thoeris anti-defense Tad2 family protein n=1 Tax=Xenorhabdus sp. TH1 TaxID=3130166 RepID=UPI0030CE8F3C
MSEINKPENLNANLKCSFNPDSYVFHGFGGKVAAPTGSLAWALSHVYIKKQLLYRIGWNAPKEHIRLAHQTIANSEGDGSPYIEKSDKNGYWLPWEPTQEDLIACDWKILMLPEPPPYWVSFDLKIGRGYGDDRGYATEEAVKVVNYPYEDISIGTLSNFQNKTTTIREVIGFISRSGEVEHISFTTYLILVVTFDKNNRQKTAELISKDLYLTVDDRIYKFSVSDPYLPPKVDGTTMTVIYGMFDDNYPHNKERWLDLDELNDMMRNNLGKTKHFHLGWYDK